MAYQIRRFPPEVVKLSLSSATFSSVAGRFERQQSGACQCGAESLATTRRVCEGLRPQSSVHSDHKHDKKIAAVVQLFGKSR